MGKYVYRKSLIAKIVLEREFPLLAYQIIKNEVNKYSKITEKMSFEYETILASKSKAMLITMCRRKLNVFLPLNPSSVAKKYKVIDASNVAKYAKFPSRIIIDNNKALDNVVTLIDRIFKDMKLSKNDSQEDKDYSKILYERSFLELFNEGEIRQYLKKAGEKMINREDNRDIIDLSQEDEEMCKVTFTAKLLYCAENEAEDLYVVTNVNDWNTYKSLKMKRTSQNTFEAFDFFKKGTKLEFKICRDTDWYNVEKGIWKEEIVNHHYIVNEDLDVEDLIHNFRII